MCGLLFEYDVRLSVKLYFAKSYMNIRTRKADELLVYLLFIFTDTLPTGLEPVSPSFAKHSGAKRTYNCCRERQA